jgi:hypothetical protein
MISAVSAARHSGELTTASQPPRAIVHTECGIDSSGRIKLSVRTALKATREVPLSLAVSNQPNPY